MEAENVGEERDGRGEVRAVGRLGGWAVSAAAVLLTAYPPDRLSAQDTTAGKRVYVKWCAGCHGDAGAGDGPAASHMLPRPRDFTGAIYKIRTTASGQLPTDQDVLRSIEDGLPGTAMPAWKDRLSERGRRDVVAYLKTFSAFFQDTSQHIVPLTFSKEPGGARSAEALRVGRQFYDSIGCWKCHGKEGRGDGPSAPTLKTDPGEPIFAADLHESWRVRGGPGPGGNQRPPPPPRWRGCGCRRCIRATRSPCGSSGTTAPRAPTRRGSSSSGACSTTWRAMTRSLRARTSGPMRSRCSSRAPSPPGWSGPTS